MVGHGDAENLFPEWHGKGVDQEARAGGENPIRRIILLMEDGG